MKSGASLYEEHIKRVFPNAYVKPQDWSYDGPIWFKFAIATGDNAYCHDIVLGLGQSEEKAWLDAYYGFRFLKKHLGIETKGNGIKRMDIFAPASADVNYAPADPVEEELPLPKTDTESDDYIEIDEEEKKVISCEAFCKDANGNWVPCESAAFAVISIRIHRRKVEKLNICRECYNCTIDVKAVEEFTLLGGL